MFLRALNTGQSEYKVVDMLIINALTLGMRAVELDHTYLYKLHLLSSRIDKFFDTTLQQHSKLSLSQLKLLLAVEKMQPAGQHRIADFLSVSPAAVSRQVEVCRRKGWVGVESLESDRRGQVVSLTTRGTTELRKALDALEKHAFGIFMHENEQTNFMRHIDLVLEVMEASA